MEVLLYLLVFLFGYITCRTFYFVRSARTSLQLIRAAQLISLGVLARSMESFHYASTYRLNELNKTGFSDIKINSFKEEFEKELDDFKHRSIRAIIHNHSGVFKDMIKFEDWDSAMRYLEEHSGSVQAFFLEDRYSDRQNKTKN